MPNASDEEKMQRLNEVLGWARAQFEQLLKPQPIVTWNGGRIISDPTRYAYFLDSARERMTVN